MTRLGFFAVSSILAGLVQASPIYTPITARWNDTAFTAPDYLNVSYQSEIKDNLPSVLILATGGTIAGQGDSPTDAQVYKAGSLPLGDLVERTPEILDVANVYGVQVANVDSALINSTIKLTLARAANDLLCSDNSPISAIIITHGTDTLEETAFFLDSTYDCDKPVIFVGSMRPASAISTDGPSNLYQAVKAGIAENSKGRGTLVVLNDRIGAAAWTQKTHINYVDTFKGPEPGYLGGFFNNQPFYYYTPARSPFRTYFDVSGVTDLPRVDILYGHQEADARLLDYAASLDDVKGIIVALPTPPNWEESYANAASKKPVVTQTRVNVGMTAPIEGQSKANSTIAGGLVNNQKSRILLQLALATGKDPREVFEGVLRKVLWGEQS